MYFIRMKNKPARAAKPNPKKSSVRAAAEHNSRTWLWALLTLIITIVCFWPMLQNGFTNWDDENYVLTNGLLSGPDWKGIFSPPVVSNYHPLTVASLAFNYQLSKLNPSSYLWVN